MDVRASMMEAVLGLSLAVALALALALAYRVRGLLRELDLARLAQPHQGVDRLTSLPEEEPGMERFREMLLEAQREGRPLACIVFDLDGLESVNAEHGRSVGDDIVRAAARALTANARRSDLVVRRPGKQFIAILPGVGVTEAVALVERMRQAVYGETAAIVKRGMTTSAGMAVCEPGWIETTGDLLGRAEAALSESHAFGRDSLRIAPALSASLATAAQA